METLSDSVRRTETSFTRALIGVAVLVLQICWVADTHAQVSPSQQGAAPPRDQATRELQGTASLKGTVVEADTGKPLRRAKVSVSSTDVGGLRKDASTGLDGKYEFKELPAGSYKLSVTRSGYLPLDYGQRRPGELGRPIDVADGQALEKLDFALPRMGVISGLITDERGDPIEGVTILAMRSLFFNGRRTLVPVGSANVQTDDTGMYRISRLPPGSYYVMAMTRETWKVMENGKEVLLGYLPTYFPGAPNAAEARRVSVGVGQQLLGIDLGLVPGRTARVSGRAVDSEGKPFKDVSLSQEIRGLDFASFRGGPSGHVAGDGTFTIPDVPPGDYVVTAMRMEQDGAPEVAQTSITIDGTDIDNVSLSGSAGGSVTGRVIADADGFDPTSVRMTIGAVIQGQASPAVLGAFRNGGGVTRVKADGSFTVSHVFGPSRFQVSVPGGWFVKTITHDGRDLVDSTFELASGETWTDVDVTLSKRNATINGDIVDDQNAPITSGTVILFSSDKEKWFDGSRYLKATRPNQQGQWRITGLPEGDYLVAAVEYVENGEWKDPEYLASLRDVATRVSVADGGANSAHLKLVVPK